MMHSTRTVLTLACGVPNDGHIRLADATSVKSSKVGTMLLCDRHANLHVIVAQPLVSIGKCVSEQQAVGGFVL